MAYSEYKGRCVGRLMYFLYPMIINADSRFEFSGDGKTVVDRFNSSQPFATYEWIGDSDIPYFHFTTKDENQLQNFIRSYNRTLETEMEINKILNREPYSHSNMLKKEEDLKKERSEKFKKNIFEAIENDADYFSN